MSDVITVLEPPDASTHWLLLPSVYQRYNSPTSDLNHKSPLLGELGALSLTVTEALLPPPPPPPWK